MTFELVKDEILKVCEEGKKVVGDPVRIYEDLEDLKVVLVDYTRNPYKAMVDMALMTWGDRGKKWELISPETRFYVVKEVLERRALPLALEAPKFSFYIGGVTRACFDQIARARIGVVFAARGFKDNDLSNVSFIVPHRLENEDKQRLIDMYEKVANLYRELRMKYPGWTCRYIMPMGTRYNFFMSINYKALQQLCASRMQTTEQIDTVALAWYLREKVKNKFPLLAEYLRPACDWSKRDTTVAVNGFASILGLPHNSDGRIGGVKTKSELRKKYKVHWDEPCTDIKYIEAKLGIKIPGPDDWIDYTWETLDDRDKMLFEEG